MDKVDVPSKLREIKVTVCVDQDYKLSDHVYNYISQGRCTPEDIEFCIQHATTIHGIYKDDLGDSPDGMIYKITGKDRMGVDFYTTGKFKQTSDDKIYFFITAHDIPDEG